MTKKELFLELLDEYRYRLEEFDKEHAFNYEFEAEETRKEIESYKKKWDGADDSPLP